MVTTGASEITSPFRARVTVGARMLSVFQQQCDKFAEGSASRQIRAQGNRWKAIARLLVHLRRRQASGPRLPREHPLALDVAFGAFI
jgi:hypothetical protein